MKSPLSNEMIEAIIEFEAFKRLRSAHWLDEKFSGGRPYTEDAFISKVLNGNLGHTLDDIKEWEAKRNMPFNDATLSDWLCRKSFFGATTIDEFLNSKGEKP